MSIINAFLVNSIFRLKPTAVVKKTQAKVLLNLQTVCSLNRDMHNIRQAASEFKHRGLVYLGLVTRDLVRIHEVMQDTLEDPKQVSFLKMRRFYEVIHPVLLVKHYPVMLTPDHYLQDFIMSQEVYDAETCYKLSLQIQPNE
jgi:hypothetical protein